MNPTINRTILFALLSVSFLPSFSQNLDSLMEQNEPEETVYTSATFKGTRLINGHSVELPGKGVWQLMFSHRFGTLEDPVYTFLGMNQAAIRFGLDYGISNKLAVGIGRSSGLGGFVPPPTYDFYAKYKIISQSAGVINMPFTISILGALAIDTEKWPPGVIRTDNDRFAYTGQILIARKFSERFSLQLMPTFLHRNLVEADDQKTTLFSMGVGARLKVSKRMALTAEYYYNQSNTIGEGFYNPVAIGFDVDTGGHVFQIMLTNSTGLIEPQFLGRTTTNFTDGAKAVRLGFNFSRVFNSKKNNKK
ncbi:MAG: hypothetical protein HOP08_18325 [Cyclobacteriaceae bacterium]|nr:hypothetical protein [Cyclobacteriaceae bacterium]